LKRIFHILIISIAVAVAFPLVSCEKKIDTIKKSEVLSLPSVTGKYIKTVFTDSGKVELVLTAKIMESYNNADPPYSEFKSGIEVMFFDGHEEPVGTVYAKYAKYIDKKKLWELKDSVVVVNETKDKLETEQLFWDQEKDQIYTDRFIKITNEDQTVMGTGFESDHKLTRRKIKNVTATIYLKDE